MKLRNKKTGEIVDGRVIVAIKSETDPSIIMHDNTVGSVAELNENWEDADLLAKRTKNRIELLERMLKREKALLNKLKTEGSEEE